MSGDLSTFTGQGWIQFGELLLAFALSACIGFERQLRGRAAGMRTQALVGTASALFMLVSKYGFFNVLGDDVVLDPSRVAAQVVSGIGFLGAGLILTRRGSVLGLTTAASVWETTAIGMAAGSGLWLLAIVVTILHFFVIFGLGGLVRRTRRYRRFETQLEISYRRGQGVLRNILATISHGGFVVSWTKTLGDDDGDTLAIVLGLSGTRDEQELIASVTDVDGVLGVRAVDDSDME